jgi:glycosyltransferase involved in cell wall biosynthesis
MNPDWICSQLGAREHYAIPRALHRTGRLRELHTDLWSAGIWQVVHGLGAPGRDLAGRFHPELRTARVRSHPLQGLPRAAVTRFSPASQLPWREFRQSRWLDRLTARSLRAPGTFFSYTGTFLESARRIHALGGKAILGQVDPAASEAEIVAAERRRWPRWETGTAVPPVVWRERRRAEWEEADLILVNSEWSRQCLQEQGVPGDKLRMVPLAYEPPHAPAPKRCRGPKLRVLWLGQVILRKGFPYFLDAARRLTAEPVEFQVAGSIGISSEALASAPPNVRLVGPVSRCLTSALYASSDLFVLPTLSDGFAITQLEAMAHGLPVIATPRCGEVVIPGQNGLLVPPADGEALAEAIATFVRDPERLEAMAEGALRTSRTFGLDRLSANLLQLLAE